MKEILIATHGKMASGIRYTAEMIAGKAEGITTIDAYVTPEDNVEQQMEAYFQEHEKDRVIVFTDLMGGSVNQKLMKYADRPNVTLITGTNLPVLIQVMLADEDVDETELQEYIDDARQELQMICMEKKEADSAKENEEKPAEKKEGNVSNESAKKPESTAEKAKRTAASYENSTAKIAALRVDDRLIAWKRKRGRADTGTSDWNPGSSDQERPVHFCGRYVCKAI